MNLSIHSPTRIKVQHDTQTKSSPKSKQYPKVSTSLYTTEDRTLENDDGCVETVSLVTLSKVLAFHS